MLSINSASLSLKQNPVPQLMSFLVSDMSSSVRQGFQLYLDPPHISNLKLAPSHSSNIEWPHINRPTGTGAPKELSPDTNKFPATITDFNIKADDKTSAPKGGVRSFNEALADASEGRSTLDEIDNENAYVHPLAKRSAYSLSQRSLELCTEQLGSESGSHLSGSYEFPSTPKRCLNSQPKVHEKYDFKKKLNTSGGFPPPLTSIRSSAGCIQVRPHREGGRLIMQVTRAGFTFQEERSGGRLRLRLVTEECDDVESEDGVAEGEEEEEEDEEEAREEKAEEKETEDEECDGGRIDCDENQCESACSGEDVEGNSEIVGGEVGKGKLPRPGRCGSGSSKDMSSWGGPCCVAIS